MPRWTKAMPSNDRLCRFQSRMFSGETPVFGDVGVRSHSITSRSASPNGSGRISAASASEKMALLTPMPSARVSAATTVNPRAEINCRCARRTSLSSSSSRCVSRIAGFLLLAPCTRQDLAGPLKQGSHRRAGLYRAVVISSDEPIRQSVAFTRDCVEAERGVTRKRPGTTRHGCDGIGRSPVHTVGGHLADRAGSPETIGIE